MSTDQLKIYLRKPEPSDLPALYDQKNDAEVKGLLGGTSSPMSRRDLEDWLEFHRKRTDEIVWSIVSLPDERCLGHVGLYKIDPIARSAEFGIMVGAKETWGQGVGKTATIEVLRYAFDVLNLHRIALTVLATNERAIRLYRRIGFLEEGRAREAVYKNGCYVDLVTMGILDREFAND